MVLKRRVEIDYSALRLLCVFFLNDTATTEIYTLSLHDALPIYFKISARAFRILSFPWWTAGFSCREDRKSTRLNSSHTDISYGVFCLKKNTYRYATRPVCCVPAVRGMVLRGVW